MLAGWIWSGSMSRKISVALTSPPSTISRMAWKGRIPV
jgi:hypothetical protein